MKVFISNIDTPLGWNLSRILSTTLVGSRQPDDQEEEDEEAHKKAAAQTPYTIIGTISSTEVGAALPFMETGNKKRDQARRDAIERHPVPGTAPRWATRVSVLLFNKD